MSWLDALAVLPRPPDPRPVRVIEQEILDELQFHIEMRTLDNRAAGMPPHEARHDAMRRFGDFERIHKACRRTLLGERIMLQRIQAVLTLVLLGAVIVMGIELYRGQRVNEATTTQMIAILDKIAPPWVVETTPRAGDADVDPGLREIRVTFNKDMSDGSWSWCGSGETYPETTGDPRYEKDHKTCVLPVKLHPGEILEWGELARFRLLQGRQRPIGDPLCPGVHDAKIASDAVELFCSSTPNLRRQ